MMNSFKLRNLTWEQESKFIQDHITSTEKTWSELCLVFSQYTLKAARMRDKRDEIAQTVAAKASETEGIGKSLGTGLLHFASVLANISDYEDARVSDIDKKVVRQLSQYEDVCKRAREDVKIGLSVREREMQRKKQYDRLRDRNPRNRQQILQAETELVKAKAEVSRTVHGLEERVTQFECQKLHDIKNIFLDFIAIEIGYHAKALEQLTAAFKDVRAVDEDSDLDDFKKLLQISNESVSHGVGRKLSRSLGSLNSLLSTKRRHPGIPTSTENLHRRASKSSETLNSVGTAESDSEDSSEDDDKETEEEKDLESVMKPSPFIAKKYLH